MTVTTKDSSDRGDLAGRKVLFIILAVGALLRLSILWWYGNQPPRIADEGDYNRLAVNLVEHHEYGFEPKVPTSLRPPLYPAAVAAVFEVFGSENWHAVRGLQIIISLATVVVVYQLGLAVYSQTVAIYAAGLTCFYPSMVAYCSLILTETLFIFFLCATSLAIVKAFQRNSLPLWFAAGVLLGLGALTRSVLWLFPPLLALLVLQFGDGRLGRRIGTAVAFCSAFALTIAPWTIRNTRLQETFITIDVMGGRNLMMGNYAHTPLYRAWDAISISGDEAWDRVLRRENPELKVRTQGQIDKAAMASGLRFMLANPLLTVQRCCIKLINFWQLEREIIAGAKDGFFGSLSKPTVIALALAIVFGYCLVAFASLFGIVLCRPSELRIHLLFLLITGFICAMHTLTFGHSRYHLPLIPILSLYAAAAIVERKTIWQNRRTLRFAVASALCILLAFSWAWEFVIVDPQRYMGALQ